ncbi:MAG: DUF349 domain-containing protein [Lutibacter sp.]|nr:DUF349 domain-containing protein [Lutibacter sp.]MDP3944695.1 DUF349 domain-containing protein [Lutibacter sp.]
MLDDEKKLPIEETASSTQISEIQEETQNELNIADLPSDIEAVDVVESEVDDSTLFSQNSENQEDIKNEIEIKEAAASVKVDEKTESEVAESVVTSTVADVQEDIQKKIKSKKTPSSSKAVDEMDTKIAESSENVEHSTIEMIEYADLNLEDLVAELSKLVKENQVHSITNNVNAIKQAFHIKYGELLKAEKDKFVELGGNLVDFQFSSPLKSTYNSILYDFKIKRNEFYASQEKQLNDNLQAKLGLIEELKHLIDNAEGATMYKMFKDIQNRWVKIGLIPRVKYNDTWRTYQHHVERFYDLLHLSNDLRDLDFKHNLEEKLKLVARAEELAESDDVNAAFKELQVLHKLWKEDFGPIAAEQRDEVWDRFSEATRKVHDKRHDFFKDMKSKYEGNVEKKLAVIAEIEALDTSKNLTRADWQKSIKELEILRNKFSVIKQVPREKSDFIWDKYKEATRKFNVEKNNYFKLVKHEHLANLNKKKALIEQAEAIKDSEDWDTATEIMKKIQLEWKKIGHVPQKYSDKLWKEFKDACNHYFDRFHQQQDAGSKLELDVFSKKKELLTEIKEAIESKTEITISALKEYVKKWREMGRVPQEMKHIEVKFNKLLDKIVEENEIDKQSIEMIKFENLVNSYIEQKNYRKLDSEQLFVRRKMEETSKEIQQLENNIGFISNVADDNPLVINVRNQINVYKDKLEVWKAKLDFLRQLDY